MHIKYVYACHFIGTFKTLKQLFFLVEPLKQLYKQNLYMAQWVLVNFSTLLHINILQYQAHQIGFDRVAREPVHFMIYQYIYTYILLVNDLSIYI